MSHHGPDGFDHVSDVVGREKRFYDAKRGSYARVRRWISRAIGELDRESEMHALYDPAGKAVLDYGCGGWRLSLRLLEGGASRVTGIDVSEARLAQARALIASSPFAGKASFLVVDAHRTSFRDATFDLVVGSAVLHHLDMPKAFRELRRILKPGGRAVFAEPLAHNPILRAGRAITPSARTQDEHPLTAADWDVAASVFDGFSHREVELLSIPMMPLNLVLSEGAQRRMAPRVARADDRVMARYPALRRYARLTFLVLE